MDKKLVGKWRQTIGDDYGAIVNIFDEAEIKIKLTFEETGYYNFNPNCAYESDGCLCWEINDEYYRMVYHVKYEDGTMKGYYTQFGKETPIEYERVSDTPEDGEFVYAPVVPETDMTRIDALRKHSDYSNELPNKLFVVECVLHEPIPDIVEKYGFSKYVENISENDDALVFAILDFVCDNFRHNGQNGTGGAGVEQIINFCEKNNSATNCRGLAIMLASLLRMKGIKASHVTCKPYEEPFNDCHVVVDCILPSGARVMLDPTYHMYLKDKNGDYVSLRHLREMLISGEEYFANDKASYNGEGFDIDNQRTYMTKNTFRFSRCGINRDGFDENDSRSAELIPLGYPTEKFNENQRNNFITNADLFWQ